MLPEEDVVRMRHMLDAARQALAFVAGRQREDLDQDAMLLFAVVRAVEIIGEAAANVGQVGRSAVSAVPWPKVVGMRHRIVHAYYDINRDLVWEVVQKDLAPLIAALEDALAHEEAS